MSFSGTPLGQGRRLDHHTFLNKPHPSTRVIHHPTSPQRSIPTSYAYGAPTAGTRSPPKLKSSAIFSQKQSLEDNADEPALVRYARIKQKEQEALTSRSGIQVGSGIVTSPPHPEKWAVKDTSVNIATAFSQAASTTYDMQPTNPNAAWASGSQLNLNVPRSTSVEYEKETQNVTHRRLAPPPDRLAQRHARKPLSKQHSINHVSDSEGEDIAENARQNERGKSPFEHVVDITKRALAPATFYLRQRSQEPEGLANTSNGKESSYDYAEEENDYQNMVENNQGQKTTARKTIAAHKRNRMSVDNKAYRPTMSDLEQDSDDRLSDDGRRRRRRIKKKETGGGPPLTTLPVAGYDKRRRRKARGSKGDTGPTAEDEEDSTSDGEQQTSAQRASVPRGPAPIRSSVPRGSVPPQPLTQLDSGDELNDIEAGLHSIPEVDELPLIDNIDDDFPSSLRHSRSFSVGGFLGKQVNRIIRFFIDIIYFCFNIFSMMGTFIARMFSITLDLVFLRPLTWISHSGGTLQMGKFIALAFLMYAVWSASGGLITRIPSIPSRSQPTYTAPDAPVADLADLYARLRHIEEALSGLSHGHREAQTQRDNDIKSQSDSVRRLQALEARVKDESRRVAEAEQRVQSSAKEDLMAVRRQIEALRAQVQSADTGMKGHSHASDEEAWVRLKALEERIGNVEGGVQEALELNKNSVRADGLPDKAGTSWWHKVTDGVGSTSGLTIKSDDGQDVTALISHLVDSAVSTSYVKDVISRPDFAFYSSGAQVVGSLTSPTYEIRPSTFSGHVIAFLTGNGYEMGRPPVTALHHELHHGHCWPMEGRSGQLGVRLAWPTYISDFTIDHVAKEVAFDMSSAPRTMEVWGLVDGKDNIMRVKEWEAGRERARQEASRRAEEEGFDFMEEEVDRPSSLPRNAKYIRLASFTYDIHSPENIQTFTISPEIQDLGVDFGIVVLFVKDNWGKDDYTCLYRFRVHGQKMEESPSASENTS